MVGDYISTSFSGGAVATTFHDRAPPADATDLQRGHVHGERTRWTIAAPAQATSASSTAGVLVPVGGAGTGVTHKVIRNN